MDSEGNFARVPHLGFQGRWSMGLQRGMAAGEDRGALPFCGIDFIVSSRHGSDDDFMMSMGGGVRKNL